MDDLWGFKVLLLFSSPWKLGSTGVFCKCYQSKLPITAVFKCSEPPLNFSWDECLRLTPNAYIHVIKMLLCWILKSPEVKTMGSLSLYKKIPYVFFLKQGLKFFVFYCFFTIINLQCFAVINLQSWTKQKILIDGLEIASLVLSCQSTTC